MLVKAILENRIVAVLTVFFTIFVSFTELKEILVQKITSYIGFWPMPYVVAEFIYFMLAIIIFFLFIFALSKLMVRPRFLLFSAKFPVSIHAVGSGNRIDAFRKLRESAQSEIFVMGIGMAYFSSDLELLRHLLEKKIDVRILMLDPDIFETAKENQDPPENFSDIGEFNSYFHREGHEVSVRASLRRLLHFQRSYKDKNTSHGTLEIRCYKLFLPFNFTIVDAIRQDGKMLVEIALPYSERRVMIDINRKMQRGAFDAIKQSFDSLWDRSQEPNR